MYFPKYKQSGAYHWKLYDRSVFYRRHIARIKEWVKEKNTLDIGAGDGIITAKLGIIGIDNEPEACKLAMEKGAVVALGDAYKTNFAKETFDSVLMVDVIEHFEFPIEALKEARRILKKYLYIVTPPKDLISGKMDKYHYQEWTPEGLKEMVESLGFKLEGEILIIEKEKSMYAKFKK